MSPAQLLLLFYFMVCPCQSVVTVSLIVGISNNHEKKIHFHIGSQRSKSGYFTVSKQFATLLNLHINPYVDVQLFDYITVMMWMRDICGMNENAAITGSQLKLHNISVIKYKLTSRSCSRHCNDKAPTRSLGISLSSDPCFKKTLPGNGNKIFY